MKLIEVINDINDKKYNAGKISTSTYVRLKETTKIIEKSEISNLDPKKISSKQIRDFLNSLIYDYSDSTIGKIYMQLNKSFKVLVKQGYINKNLMEDTDEIPKPSSRKGTKKVEALTIEEQQKLIKVLCNEEAEHEYKDIILLMLYLGSRVGEVLAINYKTDIDFIYKELKIHRTLTRSFGNKYVLGNTTKTYTSNRICTITPIVERILREALFLNKGNSENMLFWDYKNNDFIKPYEVNQYLKRIAKKYNICSHIHNHMLRHTYATRSIEAGVPAVVLQKKLGHKDVSITLNTYTSVFSKFEDKKDDDFMKYLVTNNLMI